MWVLVASRRVNLEMVCLCTRVMERTIRGTKKTGETEEFIYFFFCPFDCISKIKVRGIKITLQVESKCMPPHNPIQEACQVTNSPSSATLQ